MPEEPSAVDRELDRLRAKTGEQEAEIAQLRSEAAEATDEIARLGAEAEEHHRRERALGALVERLRSEARVREEVIAEQLERLAADELELDDTYDLRPRLGGD